MNRQAIKDKVLAAYVHVPRTITEYLETEERIYTPTDPVEFLAFWAEKVALLPEGCKNPFIEVAAEDDFGLQTVLTIKYERDETPEETAHRREQIVTAETDKIVRDMEKLKELLDRQGHATGLGLEPDHVEKLDAERLKEITCGLKLSSNAYRGLKVAADKTIVAMDFDKLELKLAASGEAQTINIQGTVTARFKATPNLKEVEK